MTVNALSTVVNFSKVLAHSVKIYDGLHGSPADFKVTKFKTFV
jgi:hypothetical protein